MLSSSITNPVQSSVCGLNMAGNTFPPGAIFRTVNGIDIIGNSVILYQSGDASTWQTTAVWGWEYNATMAAIDTLMGGNVLFVGTAPRYFTWAGWMDHAAINDKYLFLGIKEAAGYNVDQSANRTRIRRYLNSVDQTLLISDIITSGLSDTAGTHTGQLWVPDKDGIYRLTASGNPNIQGGAWDAVNSKLIAPTTYPTRGIRTQKGTRYPTTDVSFKGMTCSPAMTNKVTCRKTNPVDASNLVVGTLTVSVVNDPSGYIAAAGLSDICTSGKLYKIVNSSGSDTSLRIGGQTGNTNVHSYSLCAVSLLGENSSWVYLRTDGADKVICTTSFQKLSKANVTPDTATRELRLWIKNGDTVYFILPELIEAPALGALCLPPNAGADGLAAYTRPAAYTTYSTESNLFPMASTSTAQNFAFAMRVVPLRAGQVSAWMLSSYVDADNYTGILATATQVILRKRVAGVDTDVTLTYTHAANAPFWVAAIMTDQGMSAKSKQDGGAWSAWADVETAAGKASSPIASTYQIGALNNISGFAANYPVGPQIIHLGSQEALAAYKTVAEAKLAEILI